MIVAMVPHHGSSISNANLFTKFKRTVVSLKFCQKLNFTDQQSSISLVVKFCPTSHGWVGKNERTTIKPILAFKNELRAAENSAAFYKTTI